MSRIGDSSKPISVYAQNSLEHPISSASVGLKFNVDDVFTAQKNISSDNISTSFAVRLNDKTYKAGIKTNLTQLEIGLEFSYTKKINDTPSTTGYTSINLTAAGLAAAIAALNGYDFNMVYQALSRAPNQ